MRTRCNRHRWFYFVHKIMLMFLNDFTSLQLVIEYCMSSHSVTLWQLCVWLMPSPQFILKLFESRPPLCLASGVNIILIANICWQQSKNRNMSVNLSNITVVTKAICSVVSFDIINIIIVDKQNKSRRRINKPPYLQPYSSDRNFTVYGQYEPF